MIASERVDLHDPIQHFFRSLECPFFSRFHTTFCHMPLGLEFIYVYIILTISFFERSCLVGSWISWLNSTQRIQLVSTCDHLYLSDTYHFLTTSAVAQLLQVLLLIVRALHCIKQVSSCAGSGCSSD